jgi:HECT-domain (ubiquitin-transferase)
MRAGFSVVKISSHLVTFSHTDFTKYFVGVEVYTAQDVVNCFSYKSDNDVEIVQESFKSILEQAIFKLGEKKHSNLIEFVKFISGSSVLQPTRKLIITPCVTGVGEVPFWPEYPLPKAQTCFNTLLIPYLLEASDDQNIDTDDKHNYGENDDNGENIRSENDIGKGDESAQSNGEVTGKADMTADERQNESIILVEKDYKERKENKEDTKSVWTVDCVLRNLELMLLFNKEAFSD